MPLDRIEAENLTEMIEKEETLEDVMMNLRSITGKD